MNRVPDRAARDGGTLRVLAPAKLNLGLWIRRKRLDGYHDLLTIFQAIDLCDELEFTARSRGLELRCDAPDIPTDRRNLVIVAARLLREEAGKRGRTGLGASIVLRKHIPHGAGLGGGSSDAAATLCGLNRLWNTGLPLSTLQRLAFRLGSDVPFFLTGGAAVGRGRGNRLLPLKVDRVRHFVLVHSVSKISTKWAYSQFKSRLTRVSPPPRIAALSSRDAVSKIPIKDLYNALEAGLTTRYPDIVSRRNRLLAHGARSAHLTGSGSTVYGVFSSITMAREAAFRLKQEGHSVDLCRSVRHGVAMDGHVGQGNSRPCFERP